MNSLAPSAPFDPAEIRTAVEAVLGAFLDEQEQAAAVPELAVFTGLLRDLLATGGKRVRPLLCVTGWYAISEDPPPPVVLRVAASLELFHTFALIHDDVMDHSDTRRGRPTPHRALAARHADHPDADARGVNSAPAGRPGPRLVLRSPAPPASRVTGSPSCGPR